MKKITQEKFQNQSTRIFQLKWLISASQMDTKQNKTKQNLPRVHHHKFVGTKRKYQMLPEKSKHKNK